MGRRTKPDRDERPVAEPIADPGPSRRSPGRRLRIVVVSTMLLVGGLYVLPWVIASTSLVESTVASSLEGIDGRVAIGRTSLDWFSAPRLNEVRLLDAEGNVLVEASEVTLGKSLASLLVASTDLGTIRVTGLSGAVRVESGTTDIERVFAGLVESDTQTPVPRFTLVCDRAMLRVASESGTSDLNELALSLMHDDGRWSWQAAAQESAVRSLRCDGNGTPSDGFDLELELAGTDLTWLERLAPRFGFDGLRSSGELDFAGKVHVAADGSSGRASIAQGAARQLRLFVPPMAQGDRIELAAATLEGGFVWDGSLVEFAPTRIQSSIGGGDVVGFVDLNRLDAWWTDEGPRTFESTGSLQVAPLARMLPNTLRMRSDVEVREGELGWTIHSRREAERRRLLVDLTTTPMTLRGPDGEVRWDQSLRAAAAVVGTSNGPALEFANLQAPDLLLEGAGTTQAGELRLIGDLAGWQRQFGELIDLQGTNFAGRITGRLAWGEGQELTADGSPGPTSDRGIGFGGRLDLTGIDVRGTEGPIWQDPAIAVGFGGRFDPDRDWGEGLSPFWTTVVAAEDSLTLLPRDPAAGGSGDRRAELRLTGAIERWLARIGIVEPLVGYRLTGAVQAVGEVVWSADAILIDRLEYRCDDIALTGPDIKAREAEVGGVASLRYSLTDDELEVTTADASSSTVSCRIERLKFGNGADRRLKGDYALRADLERLSRWFPAWSGSGVEMTGQLVGSGSIREIADGERTLWGFDQAGAIESWAMRIAAPSGSSGAAGAVGRNGNEARTWREAKLDVLLDGTFDPVGGELTLARADLSGAAQRLALAGTMNLGDVRWPAQLQGELTVRRHDWIALVRPWLGEGTELVGERTTSLMSQGPLMNGTANTADPDAILWPPLGLVSEGGIGWESGTIAGIPFGPGELHGKLRDRVLDLGDFRLPLGSGNLQLRSRISFERPVPRFVADEGRLLDGVELTPEACRQWLQFVAPLAASATAARGAIDLDLQGMDLPLTDPLAGQGAGTIRIRQASLGPGPLVEQIVGLTRAIRSLGDGRAPAEGNARWVELPAQDINFRIAAGRVHHDRLEARIGDVVIVTRGSVGSDQSIDLVAVVPINQNWVNTKPLLKPLAGLEVQVPIRGTLSRPQIDREVLTQLSRRVVEQAAGQLLDEQIQRGLGRLFGGGN